MAGSPSNKGKVFLKRSRSPSVASRI
ncbi:hypothetical protein A2U01_0106652, partial [Trifolium medium]|nr:hypothetical protein [Trifolium medium]